jgi:tetratricopeptide (TPR) repeat protein
MIAMSTSNPSHNENQPAESLEERVGMLFEELELAVKWHRPSILLAIYASEIVCTEAQLILEKKLAGLGQNVTRLAASAERSDIPMFLSKYPERYKTIFFVTGLKLETKQGGYHAYRALNIRRELLVDYRIRVVFWLTEKEAADLPVHAPDFWAFRHRAIEFLDLPEPERMAMLARSLTLDGNGDEMVKAFKKAVKLDPTNVNLLSSLGDIYIKLNKANEAIQMFRKAIRLDPRNSNLWVRLGDIYRSVDRISDARKAYKAAIELEPNNRNAQSSLASCNRKSE